VTSPSNDVELDHLRTVWAESERRMYPMATVVPQKYEQVIRLAREVANSLHDVVSPADLVNRWPDGADFVVRVADQSGLHLGDLPAEQIAGVAFALRDGELRAAEHARKQTELIAAARGSGQAWALLHETGSLAHGLMDPYQAIELHLASGATIVSSVEPNPKDMSPNYVLNVIELDPISGQPTNLEPGIAELSENEDPEAFAVRRSQLRELIEGL